MHIPVLIHSPGTLLTANYYILTELIVLEPCLSVWNGGLQLFYCSEALSGTEGYNYSTVQEPCLERKIPETELLSITEIPEGLDVKEWLALHSEYSTINNIHLHYNVQCTMYKAVLQKLQRALKCLDILRRFVCKFLLHFLKFMSNGRPTVEKASYIHFWSFVYQNLEIFLKNPEIFSCLSTFIINFLANICLSTNIRKLSANF